MKFKKIYIEITNICNLNCSFCSKTPLKKKQMTVNEFKMVIKKIKNYTDSIYLHVKGEPLTHSNLDEILKICDNNNMKVNITTNGILLKEKLPILLKHKINQINISLHCENNKESYFNDIFYSTEYLKQNTTIIYRMWALEDLNKIDSRILNEIIKYYNLDNETITKINNEKNIKLTNNIYLDKDIKFIWPQKTDKNKDYGTCYGTRTHIAILSSGVVVPCCLDACGIINLGNIFTQSFKEIIENPTFQEIKQGFMKHKLVNPLCQNCNFINRFK